MSTRLRRTRLPRQVILITVEYLTLNIISTKKQFHQSLSLQFQIIIVFLHYIYTILRPILYHYLVTQILLYCWYYHTMCRGPIMFIHVT